VTDPFFAFGSFDEEIAKKLASLTRTPDALMDALLTGRARGLDAAARARLEGLHRRLAGMPFDSIYPGYMTHPIRVSASWLALDDRLSPADLAFGLCHNLDEAKLEGTDALKAELLDARACRRIAILDTDRSRERDPGYLREYYDAIVAEGEELLIFKALDKLDNTLWWVANDIARWHGDVVLDHVCPRLAPIAPRLEVYLRELVPYVLSPATKDRFRQGAFTTRPTS